MKFGRVSNLLINNLSVPSHYWRRMISSNNEVKSLMYKEYGDPKNVLQIHTSSLQQPCENQVIVKWLFAPVNPADINTIQGKYPSRSPLPAVPGNEAIGEIVAIGSNIRDFNLGDRVLPNGVNKGTWRSHAMYESQELFKVNKKMDAIGASMLNVNPCTAYRMLKDFICLQPGETIIQNGGNSAVGQLVIQLCKIWGIKTINIVRNRSNIETLKEQLLNLGATEVLTEEELKTTNIFKSQILPQPRLALNCVCGKNAWEIQKHLVHGGIMVTYGGMSREPLMVPASHLIFKDITFKGFWMTSWTKDNFNSEERHKMYDELQNLFIEKKLQPPRYQLIPFNQYEEAVVNTLKVDSKNNVKYILDLQTDC
ncbi:PREDICTED: probable trans-2-enoyl-CoA reductase, mitochondrial [Ceratosolen solmsi marchali]|uniref:Enoyl-[acyl-carrier-protein] reductase, mitochondrial n=1 Tax=Ceratosolen solmsi marchali TaxID=326594 RepID=A0AAJ6YCA8_9HYME|nr:PREDICTED: probable trans-2-enoyl-CoA reductase, mitochondrial [Ceratosolen solmsi marchali]